MSVYIHAIETAVPPQFCEQPKAREIMKGWLDGNRKGQRIAHIIYDRSGIDKRHTVVGDFSPVPESGEQAPLLYPVGDDGKLREASTGERNDVYTKTSKDLAVEVGRKLLASPGAKGFLPEDVTHLVFASCTGFCNPGPDFSMIRELGLPQSTERYTLGFMGCYAAFPALRMATQFCQADPKAVVMVVCLELCSLHLQASDSQDFLLASSLFADGTGAALLSAREPAPDRKHDVFEVDNFASALLTEGEADMAWDIGDKGFNIVLSSYVPKILGARVKDVLTDVLAPTGRTPDDIDAWAVHPGGRAILDAVSKNMKLPKGSMDISREVLRQFGNMSSATIFFVLKDLLAKKDRADGETSLALAFGPGLTVETAVMERVSAPQAGSEDEEKSENAPSEHDAVESAVTA